MNLTELGVDPKAASAVLAKAAILAVPCIGVVVWLYHRWSSFRALVLFIALTALSLLAFAVIDWLQLRSEAIIIVCTVSLLVTISGVIAMLIPYAAEIYPVHLRGTGSGVIAASSKFGGIVGAGLGLFGFFGHFTLSALLIAVPMVVACVLLLRSGSLAWASGAMTVPMSRPSRTAPPGWPANAFWKASRAARTPG